MVVRIVQPDDVAVAELVEDVDLHGEVSELLVTLDSADLGRSQPPIILVPGLMNLTEGPITKLADYIPICQGILFLDVGKSFPFLAVTLAYV